MKFLPVAFSLVSIFVSTFCSVSAQAEEEFSPHIQGDVGGAIYMSTSPVRNNGNTQIAVPYAYFDYDRFFARFDTFGVKTLPLGYGYIEVLGRVNLDGFQTNQPSLRGINERKNSLPLGIGTFQETPYGGIFLNAFYDVNLSHGQLYELIYASKFDVANTVVYPMFGFEHFTAEYTRYFYGVSPAEAKSSIYPVYSPKANTTTMLGMVWEVPVANHWNVNIYMLRRWLGSAITQSPLVNSKLQDEAFFSLSYRY
ncbi:MAG: MipA/OmpV family protein [Gallionella sp.]|nr:MipA/OmpV family protein [Gallionella sp.]MDD4960236.1 MipA/OmpV family protein [Gallionella sp.]